MKRILNYVKSEFGISKKTLKYSGLQVCWDSEA